MLQPEFPHKKLPFRESFGQKIRRGRQAHRLSQRQLAEKAGVTQRTIALIEQGKANPTLETTTAITAVLGLELRVEPQR